MPQTQNMARTKIAKKPAVPVDEEEENITPEEKEDKEQEETKETATPVTTGTPRKRKRVAVTPVKEDKPVLHLQESKHQERKRFFMIW